MAFEISYEAPHHNRVLKVDGRRAGFTRLTQGGFWRAYSYRRGTGFGPFPSEGEAEQWVREQDAKGPIAGYSR